MAAAVNWPIPPEDSLELKLDDGSRIAVMGGGPAGSFFSYFLLEMAERLGLEIQVDIFEPKDFSRPGPHGCNMCGGIISESLVQKLAAEGINLPPTIVQRGIDAYVLHMDVGSIRFGTPTQERRIGSVYRGGGPLGAKESRWGSFDGHLLNLAMEKGARVFHTPVDEVDWVDGRPKLTPREGEPGIYDLLVVAIGVNSGTIKLFPKLNLGYQPPQTTRAFIHEYPLGEQTVDEYLGDSMHVYLLDIPRLEFGALIPKGEYLSVCLLGDDIDRPLTQSFLDSDEVRRCLPEDWHDSRAGCQCSPRMNVKAAARPYADRLAFIGDSGAARLYKDGIGSAYLTAKAVAATAVFHGISAQDFRRHYWPVCRSLELDNRVGKLMFRVTRLVQKARFARRALLRMIEREQRRESGPARMSMVLWDMFTGSAPYKEILLRTLNPVFIMHLLWAMIVSAMPSRGESIGGRVP